MPYLELRFFGGKRESLRRIRESLAARHKGNRLRRIMGIVCAAKREFVAPQRESLAPQAGVVARQAGIVAPQVGVVAPQAGIVTPQAGIVVPHSIGIFTMRVKGRWSALSVL